ncbi:MAG: DUF4097 family beta strand repeat protein [Cyclobacteriaceae bacterium]|nr:DUF4097 family beta strand repeat protein [Cyclobacteriaceae bacterium]
MKKVLIVVCVWMAAHAAIAQEFKVAKSTGRLELNIGRVTVEGHSGNEIIFSSNSHRENKDERAQGLRPINSMGLDDNTGLGINVTQKGDVVEVNQLKKMNAPDIKVLVPKGIILSFAHQSQYGGKAVFKNLENEIEVSATYNDIVLENVTGPLAIKTVYGHIEATLGGTIKGPISIVSVYNYADVALPVTTKANLKLSTSYGEILVAPEFNIEVEKQGNWVQYSDRVNGKLNGGGLQLDIRSDYGKIYMRKK